jgi:hypothetical protein
MKESRSGISVVIPCLNEETSIGRAVEAARSGITKMQVLGEVIVVDNGSTDNSASIAREHGAKVIGEDEKGYGAALRAGFRHASHDILVMGDGDLTYDFSRLDVLVEPILSGEAEFVVGNRMRNIKPGSMPVLHRWIGNPLLSLLLRVMFRKHIVRDAHCGMRAIRKDTYENLGCVTTGMEFASEMIVRAIHLDVRMTERDIVYHPRVGESKLMSLRDGWRHLRFMFLHSPTTALLLPGAACWVLGMLVVLPLTFGPVMIGGRAIDIHCMIMGGMLNILSIQFITMGLLAKAYAHLSGLREDPLIAWFYRKFTFEKLIILTIPFVLVGLGIIIAVVAKWMMGGFGILDEARILFLGIICLVNGVQLFAASYLFSIMALPRHLDRMRWIRKNTDCSE